jgi:hypothetical protein
VALEDRLKKIHQTLDSVSLCKPVTKYSAEVDSPASVAEVMENAFRAAEEERAAVLYPCRKPGSYGCARRNVAGDTQPCGRPKRTESGLRNKRVLLNSSASSD